MSYKKDCVELRKEIEQRIERERKYIKEILRLHKIIKQTKYVGWTKETKKFNQNHKLWQQIKEELK